MQGNTKILSGLQFGLPLRYERAFETSFPMEEELAELKGGQEISPYFSADRSVLFWRSLKGYSKNYTKTAIARNCVPAVFVHYLMRQYLRATNERDSQPARSKHSDPKPKKMGIDKFTKKGRSNTNGGSENYMNEVLDLLDLEKTDKDYITKKKLQEIALKVRGVDFSE